MKKRTLKLGLLIGVVSLVCGAEDQLPRGMPVRNQEIFHTTVKQQKIADCNFQSSAPFSFGSGTIVADPKGMVTLSGVDRRGKTWTAVYEGVAPGSGCELWQAYLEDSGEVDLIFVERGMDSSGGWDTILSVLLFDEQGLPFPWQAMAKFTVDDSGVRELVQPRDQKMVIAIVPERKDTERSNEHYSFHAYTFAGTRSTELTGSYGGIIWPLFDYPVPQDRFTPAGVSTLTTLGNPAGANEIQRKASLDDRKTAARDAKAQQPDPNASFDLPDLVVSDREAGRKIISSPTEFDLKELQTNRAEPIVLGRSCTDRPCHPLVLWFKQ
jgi:hypothetical protein